MIDEIAGEQHNQEQEVTDEEVSSIGDTNILRNNIREAHEILDELRAFSSSNTGLLLNNELNDEYQRLFKNATTTEDANVAKANLDQMKGIGFAMGVMGRVIANMEDDINHLVTELEYQEAGDAQ